MPSLAPHETAVHACFCLWTFSLSWHTHMQVCELPQNLYGLALYGLDRAYNKSGRVHDIDFNLHTSPFLTSRTKHALIFNTARK